MKKRAAGRSGERSNLRAIGLVSVKTLPSMTRTVQSRLGTARSAATKGCGKHRKRKNRGKGTKPL